MESSPIFTRKKGHGLTRVALWDGRRDQNALRRFSEAVWFRKDVRRSAS